MRKSAWVPVLFLSATIVLPSVSAAPRKSHSVVLGAVKQVPYSRAGDPAGAMPGEDTLTVRALLVDGVFKEWTTGELHDITDRSFVVRRAMRINDTLPATLPATLQAEAQPAGTLPEGKQPAGKPAALKPAAEKQEQWVWQRGPWLLVDRATGHIAPLRLPDYDPGVSQVVWFRDYGAYCGLAASGKSLYAVVAQVEGRRPVLAKKLSAFDPENHPQPACAAPEWQREPLRVTFRPAGQNAAAFDIAPGSAVLVEDADDPETPETPATPVKP